MPIKKENYIITHADGSIVMETASCASEAKRNACRRSDFSEENIVKCEKYVPRETYARAEKRIAEIRAMLGGNA